MGKNIHMYNSTPNKTYVQCSQSLQKGYLSQGSSLKFGVGKNGNKDVQVKVYDNRGRLWKQCNYSSWCDHSWIIRRDGVKRQKHGSGLSVEDPNGAFHPWTTDNTNFFAEEERREEERRRQIEAEKQRKGEEARRLELERRRKEQDAILRAFLSRQAVKKAEETRRAEEARKAEDARKAEEVKRAEEARKAVEARRAEEARKAEIARQEELRKAEEARKVKEAEEAAERERRRKEIEEEAERAEREERRRAFEEELEREEERHRAQERQQQKQRMSMMMMAPIPMAPLTYSAPISEQDRVRFLVSKYLATQGDDPAVKKAETELLAKLTSEDKTSIVAEYSSPQVNCLALTALEYVVRSQESFQAFLQMANGLGQMMWPLYTKPANEDPAAPKPELDPGILETVRSVESALGEQLKSRIKDKFPDEVYQLLFGIDTSMSQGVYAPCILAPLFEQIQFPQERNTWRIVSDLLEGDCIEDPLVLKSITESCTVQDISKLYGEQRVDLLQILSYSITSDASEIRVKTLMNEFITPTEPQSEKKSTEFNLEDFLEVERHQVIRIIDHMIRLGWYDTTGKIIPLDTIAYFDDYFNSFELTDDTVTYFITLLSMEKYSARASSLLAKAAVVDKAKLVIGSLASLDFLVDMIITPSVDLQIQTNMISLLTYCRMYLATKVTPEKIQQLTTIFTDHVDKFSSTYTGSGNEGKWFQGILQLITLLLQGRNLCPKILKEVVQTVGPQLEKNILDYSNRVEEHGDIKKCLDKSVHFLLVPFEAVGQQGYSIGESTLEILMTKISNDNGHSDPLVILDIARVLITAIPALKKKNLRTSTMADAYTRFVQQMSQEENRRYGNMWKLLGTILSSWTEIPENLIESALDCLLLKYDQQTLKDLAEVTAGDARAYFLQAVGHRVQDQNLSKVPNVGPKLAKIFAALPGSTTILLRDVVSTLMSWLGTDGYRLSMGEVSNFVGALKAKRSSIDDDDLIVQALCQLLKLNYPDDWDDLGIISFANLFIQEGFDSKRINSNDELSRACDLMIQLGHHNFPKNKEIFTVERATYLKDEINATTAKASADPNFPATTLDLNLMTQIIRIFCLRWESQEFQINKDEIITFINRTVEEPNVNFYPEIGRALLRLVISLNPQADHPDHWSVISTSLNYYHHNEAFDQDTIQLLKIVTNVPQVPKEWILEASKVLESGLRYGFISDAVLEQLSELETCLNNLITDDNIEIWERSVLIGFLLELKTGLSNETTELFEKTSGKWIDKASDLTKSYATWTKSAVAERLNQSKEKVPFSMEFKDLWMYKWAEVDYSAMTDFLSQIRDSKSLSLRSKTLAFCCMAEWTSHRNEKDAALEFNLQGLKSLECGGSESPVGEKIQFDDFQDLDKLVKCPENRAEVYFLLLHQGKILARFGEFEKGEKVFRSVVSELTKTGMDVPQGEYAMEGVTKIQLLQAAGNLDFVTQGHFEKDFRAIRDFHAHLQKYLEVAERDAHVKQVCGILGGRLMEPEGATLLNFCIGLGEWYDMEVTSKFPIDIWPSELVRSEILARFGLQDKQKDKDLEDFFADLEEIWNSLMLFHQSVVRADVNVFMKIHQIIELMTKEGISREQVPLLLFCLHVDISKDFDVSTLASSFVKVQKLWLQHLFPKQVITSKDAEAFWKAATALKFTSGTKPLFVLWNFTSKLTVDSKNSLSAVLDFLNAASDLKISVPYINDLVNRAADGNSEKGSEDKLSVAALKKEIEYQFVESEIQGYFPNMKIFGEETYPVLNNCQLLCKRLFSDVEEAVWSIGNVQALFEIVKRKLAAPVDPALGEVKTRNRTIGAFSQCLNLIYSFSFPKESHPQIIEALKTAENSPETWLNCIQPFTVAKIKNTGKTDGGGLEWSKRELWDLLKNSNSVTNPEFVAQLSVLENDFEAIEECKMTKEELQKWAEDHDRQATTLMQYVSVLIRAVEIDKGFKPRDVQIMSFLILLRTFENRKGRLAKIGTGEGKSIILAMLAAYMVFKGKKVDVVTSNTVLAQRDAEECGSFYTLLGLTSGDCTGLQIENRKPKPCYSLDIVYGDASGFAGDVLRHEFSFLNTRGDRGFDVVFIDEVDSMLIDQGGHSTRLVDQMPAMEHLEVVFLAIWRYFTEVSGLIIPLDDQDYALTKVIDADPKQVLDVLAKTTKIYADGTSLRRALIDFSSKAEEDELTNLGAREAIRTLIQEGVYKLNPSDADAPEDETDELNLKPVSDADIDTITRRRWSVDSEPNLINVCSKLLNMNIIVLAVDEKVGLSPSVKYHDPNLPYDGDDDSGKKSVIMLEMDGDIFELVPVPDLPQYIKTKVSASVIQMLAIAKDTTADEDEAKLYLPPHLKNLYDTKLTKWIQSAISAKFHMKEGRDYLIKEDNDKIRRIVPIDYENTGVIQESTVWGDGLHQFIQIKHQLSITAENLATNFLSNMVFFQRYNKDIYGVTGTLGSESERTMLSEMYDVDTVDIPTFKVKQHAFLTDIVAPTTQQWLASLTTAVLAVARQKRVMLIVCKTIKDVDRIEAYLHQRERTFVTGIKRCLRYTRTDDDKEVAAIEGKLEPGTVILATNLAGRGTNIQIDKDVILNGGLHVCIAFLPKNFRIEEQASGRASRKGEPGSSQLIINNEVDGLFENIKEYLSPKELKMKRDEEESKRVDEIRNEIIPELKREDIIFQKFCLIRKSRYGNSTDYVSKYHLSALDERWGIRLDLSKITKKSPEAVQMNLDKELNELEETVDSVENPNYHILIGNRHNAAGKYGQATASFDASIKMDKSFSQNAFYFQAYAIINDFGGGYKERAVEKLNEAIKLIQNVQIPNLVGCHSLGVGYGGEAPREIKVVEDKDHDSEFTKQIVNKINILKVQTKSIEKAFEQMDKYKEVEAELVGLENYFQDEAIKPPLAEIDEFRAAGLIGFIKLKQKPSPWWTLLVILLLGVVEVVAGAVLAIVTGGAFGTGLIIDGVADCVTGTKAAINGEYISLGEFFKMKAIMVAISIAAAGVGAAVSAAAQTIKSIVVNLAAKFVMTGVGSIVSSFAATALKIGMAAFKAVKTLGSVIWKGIKRVGSKLLKGLKYVGRKLRLHKAWTKLKTLWTKVRENAVKQWRKIREYTATKLDKWPSKVMSETQKEKLKLVSKLIGAELAKTGLMEGFNWVLNSTVLKGLTEAIKAVIEPQLRTEIQNQMATPENHTKIEKFFTPARDKREFDQLAVLFVRMGPSIIKKDFGPAPSKTTKTVIKGVKAVNDEITRIMADKKRQNSSRNTIATVISWTTEKIIKAVSLITLIKTLATYVTAVFEVLRKDLEKKTGIYAPDEKEEGKEESVYIKTDDGVKMMETIISSAASKMAKDIAANMAKMIETGLIKPYIIDANVKDLVKKLNPFNKDNAIAGLEQLQKNNNHPERNKKASIWDIIKGIRRKDPTPPGPTPVVRSPTVNTNTPLLAGEQLRRQYTLLSAEMDRPVEVYRKNPQTGNVELFTSVGGIGRRASFPATGTREPVRVFVSRNGFSRSQSDDGMRYNPILRVEGGGLEIVPLSSIISGGFAGRDPSLIASCAVQPNVTEEGITKVTRGLQTQGRFLRHQQRIRVLGRGRSQ